MITNAHEQQADWQTSFVTMLPELERRLHRNFRNLDPASQEEAVAEGIAHSVLAYAGLHERGRTEVASPSTLAWYSSRQVKRGRPAAGRMNGNEPLSQYAQIGNDAIRVDDSKFVDTLIDNTRWDVADQVAVRIDARQWFRTLSGRVRKIAKDLAHGFTTSEVASKHGLSRGRISQMRRELHDAWQAFQDEPVASAE